MMDKVLSVMTKLLALCIAVMIVLLAYSLYNNKYEILNGTSEATLERSVYSSKDFEIGIGDIEIANNQISLNIINRRDKDLKLELVGIQLNGRETIGEFVAELEPYEEALDTIILNGIEQGTKLETINMIFEIDNKHDINISVNIV